MSAEPWQVAEIPGPLKAVLIAKGAVVAALIKRAKRPIMVVGHEVTKITMNGGKVIDYIVKIANSRQIPIVATAHIVKEFKERGVENLSSMPAIDIANRLQDPEWRGLDGNGPYDLAIFVGLPYYMEWTILSGLKHSAPKLKTISLDNKYHPHASWSFPNLTIDEWRVQLEEIITQLK
ncbi:MAG: CO dehydrogenase/acetyl-CoA synthase complex subunit epsilon [Nitrososphaerota archaeon]|nr:CO dehydrogenase/acetyl-CoA synthase complex subunit epsilon [Nitrososphaerota archaeon]